MCRLLANQTDLFILTIFSGGFHLVLDRASYCDWWFGYSRNFTIRTYSVFRCELAFIDDISVLHNPRNRYLLSINSSTGAKLSSVRCYVSKADPNSVAKRKLKLSRPEFEPVAYRYGRHGLCHAWTPLWRGRKNCLAKIKFCDLQLFQPSLCAHTTKTAKLYHHNALI